MNNFCTAFAETRVLLQGSLGQIDLCGIFKPKFKIHRTHTIATLRTVEELQCSLLTLIYLLALYQHSDCFQNFCMFCQGEFQHIVLWSTCVSGDPNWFRLHAQKKPSGFHVLRYFMGCYWQKTSSIDLAGSCQTDFQSASQLLDFSAYPSQIQTPCSSVLLMPLNKWSNWIYRLERTTRFFQGS